VAGDMEMEAKVHINYLFMTDRLTVRKTRKRIGTRREVGATVDLYTS